MWGRQGRRPVFVLLSLRVFTPFFPPLNKCPGIFFKNHLATDTSLCLHLFTASGNVTPRLFWRGLAASYLTDLQMKSHRRVDGPVVSHITGLDNRQSHPRAPEKQSYRIKRLEKLTYMDLSEVFLHFLIDILVFISVAQNLHSLLSFLK